MTIVLEERIACEMRRGYVAISGWQASLTERAKISAVHSAVWCSQLPCWLPYLKLHCASDWQIQYKYHTFLTILVSVSVRWWGCLWWGTLLNYTQRNWSGRLRRGAGQRLAFIQLNLMRRNMELLLDGHKMVCSSDGFCLFILSFFLRLFYLSVKLGLSDWENRHL